MDILLFIIAMLPAVYVLRREFFQEHDYPGYLSPAFLWAAETIAFT